MSLFWLISVLISHQIRILHFYGFVQNANMDRRMKCKSAAGVMVLLPMSIEMEKCSLARLDR